MEETKRISISIVTYNDAQNVKKLLSSLQQYEDISAFDIYIIDNAVEENLPETLLSVHSGLNITVNKENVGFGAAHNQILPKLNSKYHLILNPDILFAENTITRLCNYLDQHTDVVAITPKVLNPDGTEQFLPRVLPKFKYLLAGKLPFCKKWRDEYTFTKKSISEPIDISFCTGCFMLLRTDAIQKAEGFDTRYFMYMEDADLSRRIKQYGRIILYPHTAIIHAWHRASHKSLKFLKIHTQSMLKYFLKFK